MAKEPRDGCYPHIEGGDCSEAANGIMKAFGANRTEKQEYP